MYLRQITFIFIFCNVLFHLCHSYQKYKLESYKLCASKIFKKIYDFVVHPPEVILERGQESAVIITQKWNSTNASRLRSSCSFDVKSSVPNTGFYIVISKLNFRKTPNGCYDYLQFNRGGSKSPKICELVGTEYGKPHPIFGKRVSDFRVDIHVEKPESLKENLELEMIVTSVYECPANIDSGSRDLFQCNENEQFSCISKSFHNDGVVNCFVNCKDEGGCDPVVSNPQETDISSIALTAIISLALTMIAVGACAWICWKYMNCVRREGSSENTYGSTIEIPHTSQERPTNNSQTLPTAPSLADLPPSYESLFPDR